MIGNLWLLGVALAAQVPAPNAAEVRAAELRQDRDAIIASERDGLRKLADQLRGQGKQALAGEAASLAEAREPSDGATRFVPLAEIVPPAPVGPGLANVPAGPQAGSPIRALREKAASELLALALKAVSTPPKDYSLADECLRAAIERQPDHRELRRLLGFVPHKGGWATPYAVRMLKEGKLLHPTYGWVPAAWKPHLEKGELPAPLEPGQREPRWVAAAEADQAHTTWDSAWRISTEHFVIRTNVPLSEAIVFSRQLEDFHQLFFSLLADVFAERLPLAERLRNKARVGEPPSTPHEIYFFASKPEFVAYLEPLQGPNIAGSLGIYIPIQGKEKRRPAYFFRDIGGQLSYTVTLYHEVSHQLLFESGLGDPEGYLRNHGNYWVFEGLGTYFETLVRNPDGTLEIGGRVGRRFEAARAHLVDNQEVIPIEEFVSYDQNRFFNPDGSIYLHYQEAHALALFCMQADGTKYREGFLDYVTDAYKGKVRRLSGRALEDRLGVPYRILDAEFLAYLKGR